jgi:hypothetical protein
MDDHGWSAPGSRRPAAAATGHERRDLPGLAGILRAVDDDPWLMDASLEEVHAIAARLAKEVTRQAFDEAEFSASLPHEGLYHIFHQARMNESDEYEVYADDLERHQRRQRQDLPVSDSDSDKFTLVKRRRTYIASLFELHQQLSRIINLLNTQPPST